MDLIDRAELLKNDETTVWLSHDVIRTGKMLKAFSELFVKKVESAQKVDAIPLSVIDKIRAEIEQEIIPRNSDQYDHEAMWQNMGLRMALKVIDKYKAESEEV